MDKTWVVFPPHIVVCCPAETVTHTVDEHKTLPAQKEKLETSKKRTHRYTRPNKHLPWHQMWCACRKWHLNGKCGRLYRSFSARWPDCSRFTRCCRTLPKRRWCKSFSYGVSLLPLTMPALQTAENVPNGGLSREIPMLTYVHVTSLCSV